MIGIILAMICVGLLMTPMYGPRLFVWITRQLPSTRAFQLECRMEAARIQAERDTDAALLNSVTTKEPIHDPDSGALLGHVDRVLVWSAVKNGLIEEPDEADRPVPPMVLKQIQSTKISQKQIANITKYS